MEYTNPGRLIEFKPIPNENPRVEHGSRAVRLQAGRALILEPRTIRHQERVDDLFYLLFRRTGA